VKQLAFEQSSADCLVCLEGVGAISSLLEYNVYANTAISKLAGSILLEIWPVEQAY
jgi:hypothetical protein